MSAWEPKMRVISSCQQLLGVAATALMIVWPSVVKVALAQNVAPLYPPAPGTSDLPPGFKEGDVQDLNRVIDTQAELAEFIASAIGPTFSQVAGLTSSHPIQVGAAVKLVNVAPNGQTESTASMVIHEIDDLLTINTLAADNWQALGVTERLNARFVSATIYSGQGVITPAVFMHFGIHRPDGSTIDNGALVPMAGVLKEVFKDWFPGFFDSMVFDGV
jgi:hypothetical protein